MKYINKNLYKIISIILLFLMFAFMCYDASKQSFWIDELDWTISFFNKANIFDMLHALSTKGYNLPLYYIVMFPIYKIAPYGELWLLLPNFFAIIFGILILKKIREKIGGKDLGFASLCIAVTSYVLITQSGFELRPYAFLFLFSTWTLYRFINLLELDSKKNKILYAISMILLAYTHWYGCLIIVFYFLADAIRFIRKKIKLSFILPYIFLGITFLPWFILLIVNNQIDVLEYWSDIPHLNAGIKIIKYLLSNNSLSLILFVLSIFCFLLYFLSKKTNKKEFRYQGLCIGSIIWIVTVIFIYSRFINPNGSLYVLRYFTVLLPHVFILTAIPLAELLHLNIKINGKKINVEVNDFSIKKEVALLLVLCTVGLIGYSNYLKAHKHVKKINEPYREVSNIIAKKDDIYSGNSALMVSTGTTYLTYYFEKRGYELPPNVYVGDDQANNNIDEDLYRVIISKNVIDSTGCKLDELLKYDTLYVFDVHEPFEPSVLDFINENYALKSEDEKLYLYVYEKKSSNE